MIELGRETCGRLEEATRREWLVTNGIGGFASGTVAGLLSRRYHALLVAALRPPAGRTVLVRKADVTATLAAPDETFRLGVNEYVGGTIDPDGHRHLESFHLDLGLPVWRWSLAECRLEQRVWMARGANTTWLTLRHRRGRRTV